MKQQNSSKTRTLTEISNTWIARFNLIGDTKDRSDFIKRRRDHLTVKDRFTEVTSGLCTKKAPALWSRLVLRAVPRRRGHLFQRSAKPKTERSELKRGTGKLFTVIGIKIRT